MKDETLLLFRSLKQIIEEIAPFLDKAQTEVYGKIKEPSMDLVMGELTMVVVMLTNADSNLDTNELKLINDMRHVVYGYGIQEIDSNDCFKLCKKFLRIHPGRRMTVDHLPVSINLLEVYDKEHGTEHANKARGLFLEFSEALVSADKNENHIEQIVFLNFKDTITGATT